MLNTAVNKNFGMHWQKNISQHREYPATPATRIPQVNNEDSHLGDMISAFEKQHNNSLYLETMLEPL